jgi:hypothetical protein
VHPFLGHTVSCDDTRSFCSLFPPWDISIPMMKSVAENVMMAEVLRPTNGVSSVRDDEKLAW